MSGSEVRVTETPSITAYVTSLDCAAVGRAALFQGHGEKQQVKNNSDTQ
jgi:hypothetical protein